MTAEIVLRQVGDPPTIEVVHAPSYARVSLESVMWPPPGAMHIHAGKMLVFGTPGLGEGRVGYLITAWDDLDAVLLLARVRKIRDDCDGCRG